MQLELSASEVFALTVLVQKERSAIKKKLASGIDSTRRKAEVLSFDQTLRDIEDTLTPVGSGGS